MTSSSLFQIGILLVVAGIGVILVSRFGWPRLPGDILIQREGFTAYIPITTSIIISVVLSLVWRLIR